MYMRGFCGLLKQPENKTHIIGRFVPAAICRGAIAAAPSPAFFARPHTLAQAFWRRSANRRRAQILNNRLPILHHRHAAKERFVVSRRHLRLPPPRTPAACRWPEILGGSIAPADEPQQFGLRFSLGNPVFDRAGHRCRLPLFGGRHLDLDVHVGLRHPPTPAAPKQVPTLSRRHPPTPARSTHVSPRGPGAGMSCSEPSVLLGDLHLPASPDALRLIDSCGGSGFQILPGAGRSRPIPSAGPAQGNARLLDLQRRLRFLGHRHRQLIHARFVIDGVVRRADNQRSSARTLRSNSPRRPTVWLTASRLASPASPPPPRT